MANNPSLSQYFGEGEPPPASQFFDEIASSQSGATDLIQSVNLNEPDSKQLAGTANIFGTQEFGDEIFATIASVPNLQTGPSSIHATNLPDPATFFDTITPTDFLSPTVDELTLNSKSDEQPTDENEDRRRNAWIPSEDARQIFAKIQDAPGGPYLPDKEALTMPGLVKDEDLRDGLEDALSRCGVESTRAGARGPGARASSDEAGLRELLRTARLRAALSMTGRLINAHGQGLGRVGKPSKHSARSLQLWLTRFAVLVQLQMHDLLRAEAEAFGTMDNPDLYYQFYPEQKGRRGSMAPFSLRLLLAEAPALWGQPRLAMERLHAILHTIDKMLGNLSRGLREDGEGELGERERADSEQLWAARRCRVQHSVVNCAVAMKEYRLGMRVLAGLSGAGSAEERSRVAAAQCRLALLVGDVPRAQRHLDQAIQLAEQGGERADSCMYVERGLTEIALGRYQLAYDWFTRASQQDPTDLMVLNNVAVCLVYLGRAGEALALLRRAVESGAGAASPQLLLNAATLLELAAADPRPAKLQLLRSLAGTHRADTLPDPIAHLKLN